MKTGSEKSALNNPRRRSAIKQAVALAGAPWVLRHAHAQGMDLGPYQNAKINWRQAEGQTVNVSCIAAVYFDNLIALTPEFEALTGIKVRYDKVPPGQIRQKVVLDLSAKTANISTHAADPMYIPLYAANKWTEALEPYLNDSKLTDRAWFKPDDIVESWSKANMVDGRSYGLPFMGETTIQTYRKDLYDAKGLKPAETFEQIVANAKALHNPGSRMWGFCLRGMAGAGQNMYIYPSIFRGFGGNWTAGGNLVVNSPEAVKALEWYVDTLTQYAPPAVRNWNWPDIADAFSQGTVACYLDAHSSAAVITNPEKSKVVGKIAYARWPKGPNGKRVTSIWNWGFPINAALSDKAKKATWLFITWATSAETQARTSWRFAGPAKRSGINRTSLWRSAEFAAAMKDAGDNFIPAALESLEQDTDVEWRPRVPQWPAIGDTMATAIQSALVGQKKPKEALDEAQARIQQILKG